MAQSSRGELRFRDCYLAVAWSLGLAVLTLPPMDLTAEEPLSIKEAPITDSDREHWAFRRLSRPALPRVADTSWAHNAIDHFILAELERKQLTPQPPASRSTLIRRLTLDLTGLPPTPDEVDTFVNDTSPDAYSRLVDRILASHAYGERWAQHWLDLARFAETDGYEHDKIRPHAWKYRDWVIEAFNEDLPYDRFIQLQLAGDELAPGDPQAAAATMFCLSGPDMPDINSQAERAHMLLNEMTSTVGSALLGLQIGCAQCHDHKYDPLSQADFYRLRAIFEPAVRLKKDQLVSTLNEQPGVVPASFVMLRGDWRRPGPQATPSFLRIANAENAQFEEWVKPPITGTSGRRTAFARWLTQPDHPLTARVIVNRVWQHHFGEGLCRTPSDFGLIGATPWHEDLLDWLACELVDQGWSIKAMHRLIVGSSTYQQGSIRAESTQATLAPVDGDNELLSHFPRRRLEGEVIRDAMLAASESLDRRQGGPGVMPPLPEELVRTLLKDQWKESAALPDHFRRSIYVFARRNLRYPIFEAFDRPDANASCPRRNQSTIAPQALLLLNSRFSLDAAQRLAWYLRTNATTANGQIVLAFRRTLGRPPTDDEQSDCLAFLEKQSERLRMEGRRAGQLALPIPYEPDDDPWRAAALTDLCLALFNTNEFVYVD